MFMGKRKKIVALALAGMMSFGIAGTAMTSVTEAAHKPAYTDGTHNEFSHRLKEEDKTHMQKIRVLKYQHKRGDISEKEFEREMKKEQKRHDRVVEKIKSDSDSYERHHRRHR